MSTYAVTASATSPPTNVGIKLDGQEIFFARDATGAWAAAGDIVSTKNPVPFEFRAVGISGAPVTLKISLKGNDGSSGSFNKDYKIPNNLLLVVHDSIKTG
jgi:hypothetical protein